MCVLWVCEWVLSQIGRDDDDDDVCVEIVHVCLSVCLSVFVSFFPIGSFIVLLSLVWQDASCNTSNSDEFISFIALSVAIFYWSSSHFNFDFYIFFCIWILSGFFRMIFVIFNQLNYWFISCIGISKNKFCNFNSVMFF